MPTTISLVVAVVAVTKSVANLCSAITEITTITLHLSTFYKKQYLRSVNKDELKINTFVRTNVGNAGDKRHRIKKGI